MGPLSAKVEGVLFLIIDASIFVPLWVGSWVLIMD